MHWSLRLGTSVQWRTPSRGWWTESQSRRWHVQCAELAGCFLRIFEELSEINKEETNLPSNKCGGVKSHLGQVGIHVRHGKPRRRRCLVPQVIRDMQISIAWDVRTCHKGRNYKANEDMKCWRAFGAVRTPAAGRGVAGLAIWKAGVGTPGVTSGLQPMPVPNRKAPNTRSKILSATSFVMDANRAQSNVHQW